MDVASSLSAVGIAGINISRVAAHNMHVKSRLYIFARDSIYMYMYMYAIARICYRNSRRMAVRTYGRLDVCLSHGWIVQKRLKLGS